MTHSSRSACPQDVCAALSLRARGACVLLGAAVPAMAFSRGMMQTLVAAAVLAVLTVSWRAVAAALADLRRDVVARAVAVLFVCLLPAVAGSLDPLTSLGTYLRVLLFVCGGFVFWCHLTADRAHLRLTLLSFLAVAALGLLVADIGLWLFPDLIGWVRGKAHVAPATAASPEHIHFAVKSALKPYASSLMCQLPVIIGAGLYLGGRAARVAAAVAVNALAVLLALSSDSAVAGLLLAAGAVVILLSWSRWRLWLLAAVAVLAAAAVLHGAVPHGPTAASGAYRPWLPFPVVDLHRQAIWEFVFQRFLEHPVFGWGLNVINTVPGAGDPIPGINSEFVPSHPHNWLLEVSSEAGLVGVLPWLAVLALLVGRYARRGLMAAPRHWAAVLVVALVVAFWGSALFNFSVWASWWQMTFVTTLAIAAALERTARP